MKAIFAQRIDHLIEGRTISECARLWGIPQQSLDRYAKGLHAPTGDAVVQICRAAGVTADWLLGLDDQQGAGNARAEIAEDKLRAVKRSLIALVKEL